MKKVLIVNASARTQNSQSRKLTEGIYRSLEKSYTAIRPIPTPELANTNVPHINRRALA